MSQGSSSSSQISPAYLCLINYRRFRFRPTPFRFALHAQNHAPSPTHAH